jgi:hypothetical protein
VDNDGLPDYWEEAYFGGPTNGLPDPDDDHDGFSNFEEYIAGTHPGSARSRIWLEALNDMSLGFHSAIDRLYHFEFTTNLLTGHWNPFSDGIPGNGDYISVAVTNGLNCSFYRCNVRVSQ